MSACGCIGYSSNRKKSATFVKKFWMKDKAVCDLVMDSEVQHMRKTSFQQQYISIMVHIFTTENSSRNKHV